MTEKTPQGARIAKVLARAGVASRRGAEAMIAAGRVAVNGHNIDSPALNVVPQDKITVDGKPLAAPEPARLWLYHKPTGLVTSARDEKGRTTVFESLPEDLPRVMPVGRLDINSEGLLLLTNDGALKRALELPETGWLRRYRVRVKGTPEEATVAPLRKGITVDGEKFQPMLVTIDRQQGANAWLTVGIREGRNREVRRAMEAIGLVVNRLIRVSYGPFQLGKLTPGTVEEVPARVLREQVGKNSEIDLPAPQQEPAGRQPAGGKRAEKQPRGPDRRRGAGTGGASGTDKGTRTGSGVERPTRPGKPGHKAGAAQSERNTGPSRKEGPKAPRKPGPRRAADRPDRPPPAPGRGKRG